MCKVTDFRIGNFIADNDCEPYFFKVEEIGKWVNNTIWIKYRNDSCKTIDPEGVSISDDWLCDLGFNKVAGTYELNNGTIELVYSKGELYQVIEGQWIGYSHIKYVHQLQNLFHSLTGVELSV